MTQPSLYEISSNYDSLLDMLQTAIEEGDQEQVKVIEESLLISQDNFRDKALDYVKFMAAEESKIEGIDAEIKRLQALKKSRQNKIESLKRRLSDAMVKFGFEKFDLGLFKLSFRKSQSVEIEEGAEVPEEYQRIKTVIEPEKKLLKEALEKGLQFVGIRLNTKISLQVK